MHEIIGRCLVPGHACGEVLYSDVPLSFWMGIDTETGEIEFPIRATWVLNSVG